VNGTQLETPIHIRDTVQARQKFSEAFAKIVADFFVHHYKIKLVT
jgi:hypothetical protein